MNITADQVAKDLADIRVIAAKNENVEVYKACFAALDLTTLSPTDTEGSVRAFARRTMAFYEAYPKLSNVASICVFPSFVECVGLEIDGTPMRITSVAGGFPSSQTFVEVKALEVAMAVESGADEIDIVIPVGKCLEGDFEEAESEVRLLRNECSDAVLKVILETGELQDLQIIFDASMAAMRAGADFIKTSTGKVAVSATPEAVVAMCYAVKAYAASTGLQVGIKVAGGVRSAEDAALYYTIVEQILGVQWLTPGLFRIGASAAANTLLSAILGTETNHF